MSLTNIKLKGQNEHGFTIVELLIVVIVIAILATITIVSYNGITTRANSSAAASAASTVQKKAELYSADGPTAKYPAAFTDLTGATADKSYFLSGISNTAGSAPDASNGTTSIQYKVCGVGSAGAATSLATVTNVTGGQVIYYDFVAAATHAPVAFGITTGTVNSYTVTCWGS